MMMMMVSQRSVMGAWLLLCCCSSALGMSCRWLQPGQELLSKRILLNFDRLRNGKIFPTQCLLSTFPPNIDFIYDTEQVEIAVLTLSNVIHQINKLYSKPHLSFEKKTLEPFLASLDQQTSDLRDCN
ncbi:uncharacterized protein LOC144752797 [Lissotriton helveticus]